MPEDKYVRPKIERARLANPDRPPEGWTEAEEQVVATAKARRRQ